MHHRFLLNLLLFLLCRSAFAGAPSYPIIAMQHTAWAAKDGVPGVVNGLAQTPDGWLWLATARGLYRFDGVTFEKYDNPRQPLASSNTYSAGTLASGALWIGYRFGGFSLLENGQLTSYGIKDGLPKGTVGKVERDGDGGMWVGASGGLFYRAAGEKMWRRFTAGIAPGVTVIDMLSDERGTLWLRTADAVLALAKKGTQFEQMASGEAFGQLAKAPDGSVWMSDMDRAGLRRLAGPDGLRPPSLPALVYLKFDHQGNAWASSSDDASVLRIERAGGASRISAIDESQGLTGTPRALLADREGNVWVGTAKGLDRFRPYRFEPADLPHYMADARPLAAGPEGSLRIDRYIVEHPGLPNQKIVQVGPPATMKNLVTNVAADADGSYWIGAFETLTHVVDGKPQVIPLPEDEARSSSVSGIVRDHAGALWILRRKIQRYQNGAWTPGGGLQALRDLSAISLFCDQRGRMWFGSTVNQLAVLENSRLKILSTDDGLHLGAITIITEHNGELWIGGENGVAMYDGTRFLHLAGKGGQTFAGASGLLFDARGTLWINGLDGITGITAADIALARRDSQYRMPFVRYDFLDGLRGTPAQFGQLPTAVMGTDGRMWFSTSFGVYQFDPDSLPRNGLRPTVVVRKLHAGGETFDTTAAPVLPAGTRSIQIDYTALSLTMAERVQFKYRLEGVDEGWQEPGTRRSAFYTALAPGQYRFRVIASNNDGLWNEDGATLEFSITPAFYQTLVFKLLCLVGALATAYLLYRWRLQRATQRLRDRYHERLQERERIARALHDTLLQGVQILTTKFQLAMDRTPPDRQLMASALDAADRVIAEARDQVMGLRTAPDGDEALHARLQAMVSTLDDQPATPCMLAITGTPRAVAPRVADEILAIAHQAVMNALVHAEATRIVIALDYGAQCLVLQVTDDGKGIDAAVLAAGGRAGHWGLPGVRERAGSLPARLTLDSAPARGTMVLMEIDADVAYSMT